MYNTKETTNRNIIKCNYLWKFNCKIFKFFWRKEDENRKDKEILYFQSKISGIYYNMN